MNQNRHDFRVVFFVNEQIWISTISKSKDGIRIFPSRLGNLSSGQLSSENAVRLIVAWS